MQWLSDEIEQISGYPASDFVANAVRTFASVIHPDDQDQVEQSVAEAVQARRPFTLEYRIRRRQGDERWVLERGQAQESGDGRLWLDGAIFDITARRAAEDALRERDVAEAQLAEVRASRARILDAADRARLEIEHNLHDGAQQRFVSIALPPADLARRRNASSARTRAPSSAASSPTSGSGSPSCATSPTACTRPSSPTAASPTRCPASPIARAVPIELRRRPRARAAFPSPIEAAAYYTVCEALTNVAKYAGATYAWVSVTAARPPPRGRGRRRRHRRSTPARRLGAPGPPRPDRRRRRDAARARACRAPEPFCARGCRSTSSYGQEESGIAFTRSQRPPPTGLYLHRLGRRQPSGDVVRVNSSMSSQDGGKFVLADARHGDQVPLDGRRGAPRSVGADGER